MNGALSWKDNDLCQALFDALRRDYLDFVHLLIEYGASLDKLTVKHLDQLYASSDGENGLPVQRTCSGDVPTRNDYYFTYLPEHFNVNFFLSSIRSDSMFSFINCR